METPLNTNILNRNQIKYLVTLAMLVDHIASAFVCPESLLGIMMHFIGRLTAPTMAYFIVEGYHNTRSITKHAARLFIFAIVSWLPYSYFITGTISSNYSIMYSLFLGLLTVWLLDYDKHCKKSEMIIRVFCITAICFLSFWGDWIIFIPLWCMAFHIFYKRPYHKWIAYSLIGVGYCLSVFENTSTSCSGLSSLGIFVVPFIIQIGYNGKGGSKKPIHKWFFYVFYPMHLLILGWIRFHTC